MIRPQPYYYEDMVFQLELNLQAIRRDLIQLLEEYRFSDCFNCNRIKCSCDVTSIRSATISFASLYEDFIDAYHGFYKAPPAHYLPTPEWSQKSLTPEPKALDSWVKASSPKLQQKFSKSCLDDVNFSWPPFPKSVWNHKRAMTEMDIANIIECDKDSSMTVDAFFRYFKSVAKNATSSF